MKKDIGNHWELKWFGIGNKKWKLWIHDVFVAAKKPGSSVLILPTNASCDRAASVKAARDHKRGKTPVNRYASYPL